jgi:hypothetical protein
MNFTNILGTISYLTCFKLLFILALFFLNIYIYFSEPKKTNVLESGINTENIKFILRKIVYFTGAYASYLTIKGANYNTIEKVQMLEEFGKQINSYKEERLNLLKEAQKESIARMNLEELVETLNNRDNKILSKVTELQNIRGNPDKFREVESKLDYEVKTRDFELKNWLRDHPEYAEAIKAFHPENHSVEQSSSQLTDTSARSLAEAKDEEINKSFIFAFFMENFENMDSLGKFCITLLLGNSLLVSSLSSIIFVLYGDYLIEKYQLEVKFPKLAKIISYRRKFQRYYLIFDALSVISIILVQVLFCIAILLQ